MVICEDLKKKIIIIAESNDTLSKEMSNYLKEQGFSNIRIAGNGNKVYDILRVYYDQPEQVGLIVVNEGLPQCQVPEMCMSLSSHDNGLVIPFIILGSNKKNKKVIEDEILGLDAKCLSYYVSLPIKYSEFLIVVGFQLMMKNERSLRHNQEECLINELAERKLVDAKLKYLVVHDELTGLLNRQNFERKLRLILNRSNKLKQHGALLFIDIDRFSLVNELEGFDVGDRLLVDIVFVIRKILSKTDLFARIGSDEFCIFLENRAVQDVKLVAEKIRKTIFDYRFFSSDIYYSVSVSIGIASINAPSAIYHPSEVISRARQACNQAKINGRNMSWEYNENDISVQERQHDIYLVSLIRKALLEKKFFLVFQPVIDLNNGNISHYEALIRMKGIDNKIIHPNEFIPVAERMGLIHNIDLWIIEESIDFLAQLPNEMRKVSLAVNLSSMAFQDESLLPAIKEKLALTWVDARRIAFEITETAAINNFEQTRDMIIKIRALGCKFSLDDFGAGFCSFNYLKTFPVDYVKIDGQFIKNLVNDETDQILVKSMMGIASKLGKKTIAECVETPEVIVKLKEIGIDLAQGYIFGEPSTSLLPGYSISIENWLHGDSEQSLNDLDVSVK